MKIFLLLVLFVSNAFAQGTKANPTTLPDKKIDPEALLADVLGRAPASVHEVMGLLKMRDADGKTREVPIKWTVRPIEGGWMDVYQTPKKSKIPPEDLVIMHPNTGGAVIGTNRYEYKRDGSLVPEAATNLFIPFGTSDYWLADFGLEFLHWPGPKHIKTEMRHSRPCYVIETRNPKPGPGAYARVLSWIDTEEGGLIRAEAYDAKNELWKEFSIRGFHKVEGQWKIKWLTIRNEQTDTKTDLALDVDVASAEERLKSAKE